jgi:hypothetical protein
MFLSFGLRLRQQAFQVRPSLDARCIADSSVLRDGLIAECSINRFERRTDPLYRGGFNRELLIDLERTTQ